MIKQNGLISIGQFNVTSGVVQVTDPCYKPNTDAVLKNVKNGIWKAYIEKNNGSNALIAIFHVNYEYTNDFIFENSNIGVDSGQAGFFDSKFYVGGEDTNFYDRVCNLTLEGEYAGVIEFGAVSSSGYGDGCYDLEVVREKNEIIAARIIFIKDEEYKYEDEENL